MLLIGYALATDPAEPTAVSAPEASAETSAPSISPGDPPNVAREDALPSADALASPNALYLEAWRAWQSQQIPLALALATEVTNLDADFGEAWLLRSYAHQRLGEKNAAQTAAVLARRDERVEVRAAARAQVARLTKAKTRDDPALWVGPGSTLEFSNGVPGPMLQPTVGVSLPVPWGLTALSEVRWLVSDSDTFGVAGARVSLGLGRSLQYKKLALTPSVGPSLWMANGQYWTSGSRAFVGIRAAADADLRFTASFGTFFGLGVEVYPGQLAELDFLFQGLELRAGIKFWFWGGV